MKTLLTLLVAVALLAGCKKAPDAQDAGADAAKDAAAGQGATYAVDASASKLAWVGTKKTGSHKGQFPIKSGEFVFDGTTITGGSFDIDVKGLTVLDEGMDAKSKAKLAGHLSSPDFFEAEKFPDAKFEITKVTPQATDSTTHLVEGNLTLHGVTKNIAFGTKVAKEGEQLKAHAVFNINRQDWGVKYKGVGENIVNDDVNLAIDLVATAQQASATPAEAPAEGK
jgi:polyisoprenoid-binding protein YceI